MFQPDIPLMNSNLTPSSREAALSYLQEAKVRRLWIAFDRETLFADRTEALALLNENLRYFEQNGIETGVWVQAFGFGEPLKAPKNWAHIRSLSGKEGKNSDCFCPEDPDFTKAYLPWVQDIAKCKPTLMMLDDDLCLSVRPGIGCFCERHLALLKEEAGDLPCDLTAIFEGSKNKYRSAYLKVMGESLIRFCKKVRIAVDEVDPSIRVGHCAGYTSWDLEGADPITLSKTLAGNTKPFFRLTGAPYWISPIKKRFPGQRLSAIIECARNQAAWCADAEIEFFAEADSYPRPSYHTPASLVEQFDQAMRVSGMRTLKYLYDYHSPIDYDLNYHKLHCRNLPFYEQIEKAFDGSRPCGVGLYRPAHRLEVSELPASFAGEKAIMRSFFSTAAAMLACHGIPLCYKEKSDYAAFFGNDAQFFNPNHKKILLDLPAARLLQSRGLDLGIEKWEDAPAPQFEIFGEDRILLWGLDPTASFKNLTLKEGANVQSRFENGAPASFAYKNYLILNFEASALLEGSALFSSFARGKQLQEFFGYPFPAILNHPEIYSICAEKEEGQIALFQNHSADPLFDFEILLPKPCKTFKLIGGEAEIQGKNLIVKTTFYPGESLLLKIDY